jgi:small ligand-binding sensory domain FIST
VALTGDIAVDTIVAQGCRPIGRPMLVTRCDGGLLEELDQRPPLQALAEIHGTLGQRDRELMRHSLFLGLEMREERVEYQPGELLVRNIVAADERTGALGIGAELRPLQVVQFVLRDARTAEEDLRRMLARYRSSQGDPPAGALLFSCTGRGAGLFGRPDHDTSLFQEALGPAPLGGFFCNGEIGPVGGSTFLHGYTSAFALFRAGARPPPRR